jgi:uncharacterized Zn finger protein
LKGDCPHCGCREPVVVIDNGDTIDIECQRCGLPLAGFAREDCPFPILVLAVRSSG